MKIASLPAISLDSFYEVGPCVRLCVGRVQTHRVISTPLCHQGHEPRTTPRHRVLALGPWKRRCGSSIFSRVNLDLCSANA